MNATATSFRVVKGKRAFMERTAAKRPSGESKYLGSDRESADGISRTPFLGKTILAVHRHGPLAIGLHRNVLIISAVAIARRSGLDACFALSRSP